MDDGASQRSLGEQVAELRAIVEEWKAQADRKARIDAIVEGQAAAPPPPRRRRDRHGLHVVRGFVLLAAGGAWRWLARARVHRVLAGGLVAATAAGGTLAPSVMQPAPAAQLPAVRHHHAVVHHRRQPPAVPAPAVPAQRKRRRAGNDAAATSAASRTPAASPSPPADPDPTVPPSPLPSVPPPAPAPGPSCAHLTGHHCHGGAGDAAGVPRAPLGLQGIPWPTMLVRG